MIKSSFSLLFLFLFSNLFFAQNPGNYIQSNYSINQAGALDLLSEANSIASKMNKNVSVAVVDLSGVTILLAKNDSVGVHNTEASRRKAYTALSTKTATFQLMRNAANNKDAHNLNTMPELLLLGGGVPIWHNNNLIGAIGISGGGSGENDDSIAKQTILKLGFTFENK